MLIRTLKRWGPAAAWMAMIFIASSQSEVGPLGGIPDWITHGAAYLILSVLVCRGLAGGFHGFLPGSYALLAVVFCTLYGMSDEFHQSFVPRRDASWADVGKDLGGAALGAWLARRVMVGEALDPVEPRP